MRDPTRTLTITNVKTGEHTDVSFSDAAEKLNTSVRAVARMMEKEDVAEITVHEMVQVDYLIRRIKA